MTRMVPILNRPEATGVRDDWHRRFPPGCARHHRGRQGGKRTDKCNVCLPEPLHFESKRYGPRKLLAEWERIRSRV
jgi:hypothetical protein